MPGGLRTATTEARARRDALLAEAAAQRQRVAATLDAIEPAARLLDRVVGVVRYLVARPGISLGVLAAVVAINPRRALRIVLLVWRAFGWARRIRNVVR